MPIIKETNYNLLTKQLQSLIEDEQNLIAILSNTSAILNDNLGQINWVGFILLKMKNLFLDPFKVIQLAFILQLAKVFCGTAVAEDKTQLVEDVHAFPGHIACDANSKSEIVIPIHVNDEIIGVLDIDAPITDRFTNEDKEGLEVIVKVLEKQLTK